MTTLLSQAPIQKPSAGRVLWWGMESVTPGVAPTGRTSPTDQPIFKESITNFDDTDQRQTYNAAELTGAMTDSIGEDELTHYTEGTLTSPYRAHGISARLLAMIMGNQSYAVAAGGPASTVVVTGPDNTTTSLDVGHGLAAGYAAGQSITVAGTHTGTITSVTPGTTGNPDVIAYAAGLTPAYTAVAGDTVAASGAGVPQTHTLSQAPFTNVCNTATLWWATAVDPFTPNLYIKKLLRTTVSSVQLTFDTSAMLDMSASLAMQWPTFEAPPAAYAPNALILGSTAFAGGAGTIYVTAGAAISGSQFFTGAATINGHACSITVPSAGQLSQTVTIGGTPTLVDEIAVTALTGYTPAAGDILLQAVPTGASSHYIGSDPIYTITRTPSFGATYFLYGSSGALYAPRVLSGSITISRPMEAVYAIDNQTIINIGLGPLSMTGSFVFEFDGYNKATIARDFHDFAYTGLKADGTTPNSIRFTDADGNYVMLTSYYWKWQPVTLDYSGVFVKGNGTFVARHDPKKVMTSNPTLTSIQSVVMQNNIPTPLITI